MARVILTDVDVRFQVFDASQRSLKRRLFRTASSGKGTGRLTLTALKALSLTLNPGSRVALLGSNSSGKTTLIRIMAGLLPPTSGQVSLHGRPGAVLGMGFGINPDATLHETAFTQGLLMGFSPQQSREKAVEILSLADITEVGEQQIQVAPPGILFRLGIACMLCLNAEIILLDEVLEKIDPAFHDRFATALRERCDKGAILVVAERSKTLLSRFCSHALLLENGQIAAFGPLDDVLTTSGAGQIF